MPHPAATILSLVCYGLASYCLTIASGGPCDAAAPISEPLALGLLLMVLGACCQVVLPLALQQRPVQRRVRR